MLSFEELTENYGKGTIKTINEYIILCAKSLPIFQGFSHLFPLIFEKGNAEIYIQKYIDDYKIRFEQAIKNFDEWNFLSKKQKYEKYVNYINTIVHSVDLSNDKNLKLKRYYELYNYIDNWKPNNTLIGFKLSMLDIIKQCINYEKSNINIKSSQIPSFDEWYEAETNMLSNAVKNRRKEYENEKKSSNIFLTYVNELRNLLLYKNDKQRVSGSSEK
jgi:hypothetical protein